MSKGNDLNLDEMLRQQESGKDLDPDAVDENADRGDTVEGAEEEEEEQDEGADKGDDAGESDEQDRDEKGRFAKKDKKADDKKADDKSKDEEEEEEEEDESEDESDKKDNFPVRLNKAKQQRDEARERADRLERELAELRKGKPEKEEPKVDPIKVIKDELAGLYEQVEELRADGNTKEAAKLQLQIDEKREEIAEMKAAKVATKATDEAAENGRYDALLDQIEADVPQMDPKHDDYDRAAVRAFEYHVAAYEKMGETPSKAARMSASLLFGWGTKKAAPAKEEPAKKEPPPQKKVDVKTAVKNAGKQPPDSSTAGTNRGDDTNIKASKLSDEEFDKLPESKKRQMRGDFL